MNSKHLILFGIGLTSLALIKAISYMIEKIKILIDSIPSVYKEGLNDPDRANRIKKYVEEKLIEKRRLKGTNKTEDNIKFNIETLKEAGLGNLKNTIPQIFYSITSIALLVFIISFLAYLYFLQKT